MTGTPSCLMRQVLEVLRNQLSVFLGCDAPMMLHSNYITDENTKETKKNLPNGE